MNKLTKMTIYLRSRSVCCAAFALLLLACGKADRSGVTVTPKSTPPPGIEDDKTQHSRISIISTVGKCLAVKKEDFLKEDNGNIVFSWDCMAGIVFQDWSFTRNGEILSANGQCLAIDHDPSGFKAVLNNCDDSIEQKWSHEEQTAVIRSQLDTNLCVEIPAHSLRANGTEIQVGACHGKENQQWVATALKRQYIVNAKSPELSINIEPIQGIHQLGATRIIEGWLSAEWVIEPIGIYARIRNYWKPDQFLHLEYGALESSPIQPFWHSAQWVIVRQTSAYGETYQLRNVWRNDYYIGLDENNKLKAGTFASLVDGSTLWHLIDAKKK